MKILQINCVYLFGSTGKITADLHHGLLKEGMESVVCYGRRDDTDEPGVYRVCSNAYARGQKLVTMFTGIMYGACGSSTRKLIGIIEREKPDVVHLQCINGYFVNIYRLVEWLKENKYPTVLTLHAEFMYTGNCGCAFDCEKWKTGCGNCPRLKEETGSLFLDRTHQSWQRMKDAFDGFEHLTVVAVSPWIDSRAQMSPILQGKSHTVVFNGINTDVFRLYDVSSLRKEHGLENKTVIFHATSFFSRDPQHIKGGFYLLEMARRFPEYQFIVAGPHEKDMPVPENVLLLGQVQDQVRLAQYYSMADLTLTVSRCESANLICAEALCCGTPVVGFKAGGPETFSLPKYSTFVEHGDLNALSGAMRECLKKKVEKREISEAAHAAYSRERMVRDYIHIYQSLISRKESPQ